MNYWNALSALTDNLYAVLESAGAGSATQPEAPADQSEAGISKTSLFNM